MKTKEIYKIDELAYAAEFFYLLNHFIFLNKDLVFRENPGFTIYSSSYSKLPISSISFVISYVHSTSLVKQ